MTIDEKLLQILCCPQSKQTLSIADESLIATLNKKVEERSLQNVSNQPVLEQLDSGLIREDRKVLYPIRKNIPVLLIEEGIPL